MYRSMSVAIAAFAAGLSIHCKDPGQDCIPGNEGCECLQSLCFGGLQCLSDICVDLDGTDTTDTTPTSGMSDPTGNPTGNPTGSPTGDPTGDPTGSPTGSPTGDPTGDPTTDPDPTTGPSSATDTSDPTLPPGACGDGQEDPGEACDDGNQIDDDGCSNACELPSGPVLVFVDKSTTTVLGSKMQTSFGDQCAAVLRGVDGTEAVGDYISLIMGKCATAKLVPDGGGFQIELGAGPDLPGHGMAGGTAAMRLCAAGQVVVGFTGYADSAGLSGAEFHCAPISVDPDTLTVTLGATTKQPVMGGQQNAIGDAVCPAGHLGTGLLGFILNDDGSVIALGLHCARPVIMQ